MTWRYRQLYPENADILDPDDWNQNHKELAEEHNGYYDRDNLPAFQIGTSRTVDGAFTKIHMDAHSDEFTVSGDTIEWQSNEAMGGVDIIGVLEFSAPEDCTLICEFGCTTAVDVSLLLGDGEEAVYKFQIVVDGEAGAFSDDQSLFLYERDTTYLCCAVPVLAGMHRVEVKIQVGVGYDDDTYGIKSAVNTVEPAGLDMVIRSRALVVIERRR
jgi:hypothetical protein